MNLLFWRKGSEAHQTYHCGTLTYTKLTLAYLCASLLWGDFCWAMMEQVVPSIIPLKLKALDCPNWIMGMILTALPGVFQFTVAPVIAFRSDRLRSRWGRRLPFIAVAVPFISISLILLGFGEDIAKLLSSNIPQLAQVSPTAVTIAVIGFFLLMFKFFDIFVNTTFWYLFNDVVPPQFLANVIGGLRFVGGLAGVLYNYFLFQYAESHMREIFVGAAVLYFIGFAILCTCVKEGQYPPVEQQEKEKKEGFWKTYGRECFSHRFYWFSFLYTGFVAVANAAIVFNVFFYRNLGMELDDIGKYNAITRFVGIFFLYYVMRFIDHWHPLRVGTYYSLSVLISTLANWVWLFVDLPRNMLFWLFLVYGIAGMLDVGLAGATGLPRVMRTFPKSRFGQFCSAQGMVATLCGVIGGILIGVFLDFLRSFCSNGDYAYRFIFAWIGAAQLIAAVFAILMYREWYKLGGDAGYKAPAVWENSRTETIAPVLIYAPKLKWLNMTFILCDVIIILSFVALLVAGFCFPAASGQVFGLLLPFAAAGTGFYFFVRRSVKRDMAASKAGKPLKNGIPHHGVLMFMMIQHLIVTGSFIAQLIISISLNSPRYLLVFALGQIITNFLITGAIYLISYLERGHLTQLDINLSEGEVS